MSEGAAAVATGPDAAVAFAAVHRLCFADEPWDADVFACLLSLPSSLALVEHRQGALAGFVLCRLAADEAEVLTCAVDPAWRRRGIGSRLLARVMAANRQRGIRHVFLEVAVDTPAAQALYLQCGFRPVGRRRQYYQRADGTGVDAIVMRMDL